MSTMHFDTRPFYYKKNIIILQSVEPRLTGQGGQHNFVQEIESIPKFESVAKFDSFHYLANFISKPSRKSSFSHKLKLRKSRLDRSLGNGEPSMMLCSFKILWQGNSVKMHINCSGTKWLTFPEGLCFALNPCGGNRIDRKSSAGPKTGREIRSLPKLHSLFLTVICLFSNLMYQNRGLTSVRLIETNESRSCVWINITKFTLDSLIKCIND